MALPPQLLQRLGAIESRYEEIHELMARPEIATDMARLQELAREQSGIEDLVSTFRSYTASAKQLEDARHLLEESTDEELKEMAREEFEEVSARLEDEEQRLLRMLLPRDPNDQKDVIVEVRAGAGGDEAGLFAADLYRMYTRYADSKKWRVEVLDSNESGIGGFKEIVFQVKGKGAYSRMKYESGVHRVQRVPATEAKGRIHTSTATVAVLPEAEETDVAIGPEDVRVDVFHAGGHGGQNVNKVETAIRLTHVPTGLVVVCRDERSQLQNRVKAFSVLRARLLAYEQDKQAQSLSETRRSQVGTGDRSEKSRTYNFSENRISDKRINVNFYNLTQVLDGDLDPLIDAVATSEQARQLEGQLA